MVRRRLRRRRDVGRKAVRGSGEAAAAVRDVTWDDVVALALELPAVEVGSAYGTPALRVRGKFMCRLREDGETLAIRCDAEERPLLIGAHPGVLFLTPHYEASPMVLVALPRASRELVRELAEDAWAERAPRRLLDAYRAGQEEVERVGPA